MADGYWMRGESSREQEVLNPPHMGKRPRADFEVTSGRHSYNARENDQIAGNRVIRDTDRDSLLASYERYLRTVPISSYGGQIGTSVGGLDDLPEIYDFRELGLLGSNPAVAAPSRLVGEGRALGGSDPLVSTQRRFMGALSHDASNTLFVEGLPSNCTRREVSHLFRPFLGFKEVRLVWKESRHSRDGLVVLCFVDFQSPAHAATAMDALQGYTFDEHDHASSHLRIQFSRSPGARSGGGRRG